MIRVIHQFINELNSEIDRKFPNTVRIIINSGDNIEDILIELRENDKKLRYSPYLLFKQSDNGISELLDKWEKMICLK